MVDNVVAGEHPLFLKLRKSYWRRFTFFRGAPGAETPMDFTGKVAYIEVIDPHRNQIVKTYTLTIVANAITFDVQSVDIPVGTYRYNLVIASGGRSLDYLIGKLIVNG